MAMTIKEWKKSEVKGFDVFLETGVCIRGFKKWDKKARNVENAFILCYE